MLPTGLGLPLLCILTISCAILSYFIQESDAAERNSAFVNNPLKTKLHSNNIRHISMNAGSVNEKKDASPEISAFVNHYAFPPTTLEALRRRYGTSKNLWGEWTCKDTRRFYKQQLPRALQMDGFMGLSLKERAKLASEARHVLRLYSRERCHLPGRLIARLVDGIRHLKTFGYWSSTGMTWEEIKKKYELQIRIAYPNVSDDQVEYYVYKKILDRACETNPVIDEIALKKGENKEEVQQVQMDIDTENSLNVFQSRSLIEKAISLLLDGATQHVDGCGTCEDEQLASSCLLYNDDDNNEVSHPDCTVIGHMARNGYHIDHSNLANSNTQSPDQQSLQEQIRAQIIRLSTTSKSSPSPLKDFEAKLSYIQSNSYTNNTVVVVDDNVDVGLSSSATTRQRQFSMNQSSSTYAPSPRDDYEFLFKPSLPKLPNSSHLLSYMSNAGSSLVQSVFCPNNLSLLDPGILSILAFGS